MSPFITEGRIPFDPPGLGIEKTCETWYKVVGDLKCGKPALLTLHGGPGLVHDYWETLTPLSEKYGVPIIYYDQIGIGKSTHLPEKAGDAAFWTVDLFRAELDNLVDKLDLRSSGYDIIGHSWGGQLGSAFATYRPKGLRKLIITNSMAAQALWIESQIACCESYPKELRDAIFEGDRTRVYTDPMHQAGRTHYFRTNMCRTEVFPPAELLPTFEGLEKNSAVNHLMFGASLVSSGTLKDWSIIDRLHLIEVPTLVVYGEHDVANEKCNAPFFNNIPRVRMVTFSGASHMLMLEVPEKYFRLIAEFLEW